MIYFIQSGDFIKIGYTGQKNPARRIATYNVANPLPIKLLGWLEGGRDTERNLHIIFSSLKFRNEWFWADPQIIEFAQENLVDDWKKVNQVSVIPRFNFKEDLGILSLADYGIDELDYQVWIPTIDALLDIP